MQNKYEILIPALIERLGGVDNVVAATHCVSRLRLVLKDENLLDSLSIEKLPLVKGVFRVNGQVHIIFGQEVPDVYKQFIEYPGMSSKAATAASVKQISGQNQSFMKRMMNHLSEIFMPLIAILVAGGLILGIRNILETEWVPGVSAISKSSFFRGLNDFLWIPACAVFWFLPVFIVWSIFKKMQGSQILGILIGLSLLVSLPSLYQLSDALSGVDSNLKPGDPNYVAPRPVGWWMIADFFTKTPADFTFSGWGSYPIKVGYTSQVIPAIMVAFVGVYIERFLKAKTPAVLRQIIVPLVTVLASYSLAVVIIGPIGFVIGTTISIIFSLALTNSVAKYITAPIFGLLYAPLVITGLHHTLNAVMIQNQGALGGSLIFPILALSNISQGAACLMYGIMNRKDEKIKQTAYPSTVSAWLGVTEPAMYGVNLKNSYCFISACIGSAAASTLAVAAGVTSNGIGNGAWLGTITIQPNSPIEGVNTWVGTGWTWFLISGFLGTGISMVLTYFLSKTNFDLFKWFKNKFKKSSEKLNIHKITNEALSIGDGKVYSLDTVEDPTFKNKILGDGFAIDCLDGKIYSPISGKIEVVAPTKHAYGIISDDGVSILIHIGVDTIKLDGQNVFRSFVNQGDYVKAGKLICEYNRDKIIKAGLDQRVMLLVTQDSKKQISSKWDLEEIRKKDFAFKFN